MMASADVPSAVQDLLARKRTRVKYAPLMPLGRAKEFHTAGAAAALCGYTLARIEDDDGFEVFFATRDAETVRFRSLSQVDDWVYGLIARRAACRVEGLHAAGA